MATHVKKGADVISVFADHDNLFAADLEEEIIALVRDARDVSRENPFLADDLIKVCLKYSVAGIEFLS